MKNTILKKLSLLLFISFAFILNTHAQYKVGDKLDSGLVAWVDAKGEHGIVVTTADLGKMKWDDAMKACTALGNGWHLPDKDELNKIYLNEPKIVGGNFVKTPYWSSTAYKNKLSAWYQSFTSGVQDANDVKTVHNVRAVKAF
jgi:hypothetical protein